MAEIAIYEIAVIIKIRVSNTPGMDPFSNLGCFLFFTIVNLTGYLNKSSKPKVFIIIDILNNYNL